MILNYTRQRDKSYTIISYFVGFINILFCNENEKKNFKADKRKLQNL